MIKHYGYVKMDDVLAIPCKLMAGQGLTWSPKIGSIFCQKCKYFVNRDENKQTVECSYGEKKLREKAL